MSRHSSFNAEIKRFAILSLIIVAMVVAQFFVWRFVAMSAHKVQEKRTQAEQLFELQQRISDVEGTYDNQQSLLDQLEVIFPDQDSTSQAVERLESLAEQEQVRVKIRSISETEEDKLVELRIGIDAEGSAAFLLQYMDEVEHVSELTKVEKWTITPIESKEKVEADDNFFVQEYQLSMDIIFYMQAQNNGE